MTKQALFTLVLLTITSVAGSQVIMQAQLPAGGILIKPQMWNLSIMNSNTVSFDARIEMIISDATTNERILSATTKTFQLRAGSRLMRVGDLSPIAYNSGSARSTVDLRPDGLLPMGRFNVCYNLLKVGNDFTEAVAEDCQAFEVEPLSPPALLTPGDGEVSDLRFPNFTWTPPAPIANGDRIAYDWILVPIRANQSSYEAIQQNIPIVSRSSLNQNSFRYLESYPKLDTGQTYAWRVTARNHNATIANSETWTFRIADEKTDRASDSIPLFFTKMSAVPNGAFAIASGRVDFQFENLSNQLVAKIEIYSLKSDKRKPLSVDVADQPIKYGDNFLSLDLLPFGGFKDGKSYEMKIMLPSGQVWYLTFKYKKP